MKVRFDKKFLKDIRKIKSNELKQRITNCIDSVRNAQTLSEIVGIERMKGYKTYFKIRIGDYRIGLEIDGDNVDFIRVLNRKDIYRMFP